MRRFLRPILAAAMLALTPGLAAAQQGGPPPQPAVARGATPVFDAASHGIGG